MGRRDGGHLFTSFRRARRRREFPQIPLTPLIDIVLNLLIFFMLVTKFLTPGIDITLPEGDSTGSREAPSVIVTIDADGRTYIDDVEVTLSELILRLGEARATGEIESVRLRADRNARFQVVVDVLEAVRRSGVLDVVVETVPGGEDGDIEGDLTLNESGELIFP